MIFLPLASGQTLADLVDSVRRQSFSELASTRLEVRTFHSDYDFLRARFRVLPFLMGKRMRYTVEVNPRLSAPPDGIRAIIAHELVHVCDYQTGSRMRLLRFVRLLSARRAAQYERATDREAIRRGFGPGLILYREWLYAQLTPAQVARKKRTYLTPDEIAAALQ